MYCRTALYMRRRFPASVLTRGSARWQSCLVCRAERRVNLKLVLYVLKQDLDLVSLICDDTQNNEYFDCEPYRDLPCTIHFASILRPGGAMDSGHLITVPQTEAH